MTWRQRAACKGRNPAWWMGILDQHGWVRYPYAEQAKAICEACPVRALCEIEATTTQSEYGIWAGKIYRDGRVTHVA